MPETDDDDELRNLALVSTMNKMLIITVTMSTTKKTNCERERGGEGEEKKNKANEEEKIQSN